MSESLTTPWIHIGECPICGNGLCRLRCCSLPGGRKSLYAMCDECEAIWLQPSTSTEHQFPDSQQPLCPISGGPLYGDDSRWALPSDLPDSGWESEVIIDLPSDCVPDLESLNYATSTDSASTDNSLDITSKDAGESESENRSTSTKIDDQTFGQDEPVPGC